MIQVRTRPWVVYGLLVLASLAYCPMLFTGWDCWGRGDWDQFSFRFETPRTAMLRDGQLPLWNPYVNGGNVLAAHPHCPAFSPWYLTTLVLGAPLALRVSVLLFVALGSVGMAALLRRWGVSATGCFAGGVLLMMSAHFTMHIAEGHLEWCVMGLMPWVLLCLVRVEEGWRFVVYGALVLASAVLYGSIYIVVVFVPLLGLWAVLEAMRTRSWPMVVRPAVCMGLTFLLCAVALLPRIEFLRAHPRQTEPSERLAPAALKRAIFEPGQAALFRATRDVRNPRTDELARILPSVPAAGVSPEPNRPYETLKWHRLDVTLTTTSEWADVGTGKYPHLWFLSEGPDTPDKTPARLNSLPLAEEGLRIWGAKQGGEEITGQATFYVQLPRRGHLPISINQGVFGATKLTVKCKDKVILDVVHGGVQWRGSSRVCYMRRSAILQADAADRPSRDAPWYRLDVLLQTTSDWCRVEVVNCPYLFHVEDPQEEAANEKENIPVPVATTALDIKRRAGGGTDCQSVLRASLYVRVPENEDLRVAVTQGPGGTSTLSLRTPQGVPLSTICKEATQPGGCKTLDYVLLSGTIREELWDGLAIRPTFGSGAPLRWSLDELGMTYNWQEYGCYVTWLGGVAALLGLIVSLRRRWPLMVVGLIAGLVAMGAALPVNVWALWKLLPMVGSLQVPSRFLAVVLFVVAACAGLGIDRLGRWVGRLGGDRARRLLCGGIVLAIYVELAVLGWDLFSDVFVCEKRSVQRPVTDRDAAGFAQRLANDDARYAAMYSAHYPYLMDNSGVLREYENIAVKRGKIRIVTDPDYRGEAYLEGSHGTAEVTEWTMSRVKVAVDLDAADRLVLNQNYFRGWKVIRRGVDGTAEKSAAVGSPDGLVSIDVRPDDREVEFYYLPDSFLIGAGVSSLTLLGCLGFLLAGGGWQSWRLIVGRIANPSYVLTRLGRRILRRAAPAMQSKVLGYVALAVVLNAPFLLCHPDWTLVDAPLVRSLVISLVLFLVPGLPWVGVMVGRGWLPRFGLLWAVAASLVIFLIALAATHLIGLPVEPGVVFSATWMLTDLLLVLSIFSGGPPNCGIRLGQQHRRLGIPLFAASYLLFFYAATSVVPDMEDHDYILQGTGHGLLTRFEPTLLTDREILFEFAHPPVLHFYVAGSFLYFDRLDHLQAFDEARSRAKVAKQGTVVEPAITEFWRLPDGKLARKPPADRQDATRHRISGQSEDGDRYLIEPPLPDDLAGGQADRVRNVELKLLYDYYRHHPHRLETRTPMIFLAALTVALLGCWIARTGGVWWLGLLVPAVYATSPEVFVRSGTGGYFAVSQFALVQFLLAVERWGKDRTRSVWISCLLAGAFTALVNHKLVLLPAALAVWSLLKLRRDRTPTFSSTAARAARVLLHPLLLGFALGIAAFWCYGLAVEPAVFWADHVRTHLVDRVTYYNPFNYQGYPGVGELWIELWQHTGYLLLPLGIVALGMLCRAKTSGEDLRESQRPPAGWQDLPGLWAIWAVLIVVTFSLIDWRQTKHLMPLLLPLHLALARWAPSGRTALALVGIALAVLLLWNLNALVLLASNFRAFPITPAW